MRRLGGVLAACALLATACSSDDETGGSSSPTTATSTTVTPDSTGVSTSDTSTVTTAPSAAETSCLYRARLLVSQEDLLAQNLVDPALLTPITGYNQLVDIGAGNLTDEDFSHLVGDAGAPNLFLYDVGGNDPLQVAAQVVQHGGHASPVLATEVAFHWTFAPGTDYDDSGPLPTPPATFNPDGAPRVAVIDTGYTDAENTPDWLKVRVKVADPTADTEQITNPEYEGHGKFIASLIAQQSPDVNIVEAALPKVDTKDFIVRGDELANAPTPNSPFIADELGLLAAIGRLTHAGSFDVLNLSLGTWTCTDLTNAGSNSSGLVMKTALDWWDQVNPGSFVVAAAGNHPVGVQPPVDAAFIPGAWGRSNPVEGRSNLISAFALNEAGTQLAEFSNEGEVGAIGENLLGVRVDDLGTYWGGSSFATAIVSAWVAANNALPTSQIVDLSAGLTASLKP